MPIIKLIEQNNDGCQYDSHITTPQQLGENFNYTDIGDSLRLEDGSILELAPIHLPPPDITLEVKKISDEAGYGVFAGELIPAGTIVTSYAGCYLKHNQKPKAKGCYSAGDVKKIDNYHKLNKPQNSMQQYDLVDAYDYGNIARFIQHLPTKENLKKFDTTLPAEYDIKKIATQNLNVIYQPINEYHPQYQIRLLVATRAIKQGEILGYSYSSYYWQQIYANPLLFTKYGETIKSNLNKNIEFDVILENGTEKASFTLDYIKDLLYKKMITYVFIDKQEKSEKNKSVLSLEDILHKLAETRHVFSKKLQINSEAIPISKVLQDIKTKTASAKQQYKNKQFNSAMNTFYHCYRNLSSIRKAYRINNDAKQYSTEYELLSAEIQSNCARCLLEIDQKNNSIPELLKEARRLYIKHLPKNSKQVNIINDIESLVEKYTQINQQIR